MKPREVYKTRDTIMVQNLSIQKGGRIPVHAELEILDEEIPFPLLSDFYIVVAIVSLPNSDSAYLSDQDRNLLFHQSINDDRLALVNHFNSDKRVHPFTRIISKFLGRNTSDNSLVERQVDANQQATHEMIENNKKLYGTVEVGQRLFIMKADLTQYAYLKK